MMKKLLWILFLICMFALPVAANNVPDLNQSGSIHVTMQYDGKPVSGGKLTLYQVGDIQEEDGNYSFALTKAFAASGVTLENVQSSETAKKLSDYAQRKAVKGETKEIGKNGSVDFENLPPGLYLLAQRKAAQGYHKVTPFLVTLPMEDAAGYTYEVDASPKVSPIPTKPENPEQPQTGQSGWPIWTFLLSGAALATLIHLKKRA